MAKKDVNFDETAANASFTKIPPAVWLSVYLHDWLFHQSIAESFRLLGYPFSTNIQTHLTAPFSTLIIIITEATTKVFSCDFLEVQPKSLSSTTKTGF